MNDNKKPWYEKIYIWIGIISGAFTLLGFSVFDNVSFIENTKTIHDPKNGNNVNVNGNNNVIFSGNINGDVNIGKETFLSSFSSTENKTLEDEATSQFNFEAAIMHIYNNENIIIEEIINNSDNKRIYSSIYPNVSYSQILNNIRLIEVTKDYRNYKCSRLYHFDENGNLTFALMKDDDGEHRLYFYDDTLIRYIDINDEIYDINYNLDNVECKWKELALTESYIFLNGLKK